jgi:hypothetical protein
MQLAKTSINFWGFLSSVVGGVPKMLKSCAKLGENIGKIRLICEFNQSLLRFVDAPAREIRTLTLALFWALIPLPAR